MPPQPGTEMAVPLGARSHYRTAADSKRNASRRSLAAPARHNLTAFLFALALIVLCGTRRVEATNEVEQLKRQLQQLQENFERMQREQHQQIEALTKKLDDLTKQQAAEAEKKKLEQELAADLQKNQPATAASAATAAAVRPVVARRSPSPSRAPVPLI